MVASFLTFNCASISSIRVTHKLIQSKKYYLFIIVLLFEYYLLNLFPSKHNPSFHTGKIESFYKTKT